MLGHPRDGIHPFSDAKMLAEELPNGRLIEANSLFELRLRPRRLTNEIAAFLDECWRPRHTSQRAPRASAQAPASASASADGRDVTGSAAAGTPASASRAARSPD